MGFADFNQSKNQPWLNGSFNYVAIRNDGLFINGSKINGNISIENGKKYEFIIDISKKNFVLNIDGNKVGEYKFNFQENIYAHAAIRNLGNSIKIKTYEN